jgi:uncharacterized protein YggT (Ycf19 family)
VLIWRVLTALLAASLLLVLLRVILGWLQRPRGRAWQLLVQITEPYLAVFRRLRIGPLDLSPLAAVVVLIMALDLVSFLQGYEELTARVFLAGLVGALWAGISLVVILALVLLVIVVFLISLRGGTGQAFARTASALLYPLLAAVARAATRLFSLRRPLPEIYVLLLSGVLLLAVLFGGQALTMVVQTALLGQPL